MSQTKTVNCSQCQAEFPCEWILNAKNGAKKVGWKFFCCTKCQETYFSQGSDVNKKQQEGTVANALL